MAYEIRTYPNGTKVILQSGSLDSLTAFVVANTVSNNVAPFYTSVGVSVCKNGSGTVVQVERTFNGGKQPEQAQEFLDKADEILRQAIATHNEMGKAVSEALKEIEHKIKALENDDKNIQWNIQQIVDRNEEDHSEFCKWTVALENRAAALERRPTRLQRLKNFLNRKFPKGD